MNENAARNLPEEAKIYKNYNSIAGFCAGEDLVRNRKPYFLKLAQDFFPSNLDAKILELGCGYGALISALRDLGYTNVVGVDWSSEQVDEARKLGISGISQGDIFEHLRSQRDSSLDVVVAIDLIEHFPKQQILKLSEEVFRVLKPAGRFITHQPNAESPFGNAIRYGDFTHEIAFTRVSIQQVMKVCGFASVTSFEDRPTVHGLKSSVRYLLWTCLIRPLFRLITIIETGSCDSKAIFSRNFLTVTTK